ncbi:glucose-6-phosphate dehydrogenase [Bosea sp. (in: a-proteobacteria)]|uniref:glucose-6-phosphate dehydrogenase n=1 Tax=Bosea sp. (in: a-proteobacteria) TaxID=1871050 RepID=UPI002B466017|nr:glucose-6-phosphate dehydrogenase [Bosea sp. (in: a-proteobacteria)]WRH57811.1 MAG: glucose-6-phosphate dehydrogenase [Bosea sp. (in: a-proteobacteria)]
MDDIAGRLLRPETIPERTPVPAFDLVIFGAGGDLALRKLFPALAQRSREGVLPGESRILCIVRKQEDVDGLPKQIAKRLKEEGLTPNHIHDFQQRLTIVLLDAVKPETYKALKTALGDDGRVRSFYLSTPPDLFIPICENLAAADILTPTSRVILEKPLGRDLASAREINDAVARILPEDRTYRIDHYLGKETVQNLLVLRFANTLFERSWTGRDIDHVQITVAETVGLEARAGYYDKAGQMRDMVQNHLMQLLTLFAIEPPNLLEAGAVRDEKIKVLKALRPIVGPDVERYTVRGQYGTGQIDGQRVRAYADELGHLSNTETFVAIRCELDNWRWAGVPIYLRTGKRMAQRYSEIVVTFKPVPHSIFGGGSCDKLYANRLLIRLQPNDGVQLQLMMKVPGSGRLKIVPRQLDLRYSTAFDERTPDAYERLLTDVIRGDQTLFMHRDEVEQAWRWVDPIIAGWQEYAPHPHRYAAGSWGPSQAIGLIEREGRSWADPDFE